MIITDCDNQLISEAVMSTVITMAITEVFEAALETTVASEASASEASASKSAASKSTVEAPASKPAASKPATSETATKLCLFNGCRCDNFI